MTDAVRKLIERLAPDPVCDDCIADRLALADRQEAGIAASELAGPASSSGAATLACCAATPSRRRADCPRPNPRRLSRR